MNGRVQADDMYFRLQQEHTAAKNMKRHLLKSGKKKKPQNHNNPKLKISFGNVLGEIKYYLQSFMAYTQLDVRNLLLSFEIPCFQVTRLAK